MALVSVLRDLPTLTAATAARLTALIQAAIDERGAAMVSLTGGSTPRDLYQALGDPLQAWRARIDWPRVHLFWGDERHVPPDHPDSNFGMANEALVHHVPIPPAQVHRMHGEVADAREAARAYDAELRAAFASAGRHDLTFDIMLLGLGDDAHIASVFPHGELIDEASVPDAEVARARCRAVWAAHLHSWRITLTPQALLDARAIVMLVAGANKADAVYAAIEGPLDVARWPAQVLRRAGDRVEWFTDSLAAARLRGAPPA